MKTSLPKNSSKGHQTPAETKVIDPSNLVVHDMTGASSDTSAVKRKDKVKMSFSQAKTRFGNAFSKLKTRVTSQNKDPKGRTSKSRKEQKRAILGIGLLFVVVSIAFSTYVTTTFVDGSAAYIALAPQVAFALFSLLKAFSKIYK